MRRIPLSLIQQRFSEAIRTPSRAAVGLACIGVLNQPPIEATDRLFVYQNAYRIRIHEALEEDYPDTQAILGEERFANLVDDYIAHLPSRFWSLGQLGERLPGFVAASSLGAEIPFLADLARLEWARVLSGLSAIAEPFDFSRLSAFSPAEQQSLVLELAPSIQLFQSEWAIYPAPRKERETRIERKATRLVLFQKNGDVHQLEFSEAQWRLITKINEGKSIGTLIQASEGLRESQIIAWFSEWVSNGVIARFDPRRSLR